MPSHSSGRIMPYQDYSGYTYLGETEGEEIKLFMSSEKYKENKKWLERYITRSNGKKFRKW